LSARSIPEVRIDKGLVKVIAGRFDGTPGAVEGGATDPQYWDVRLEPGAVFEAGVPAEYNAFLYAYEGDANVGEVGMPLAQRAAGLLSGGDAVRIEAGPDGARLLLLAGKPIGEPVVQYGPFVMNTHQEIEQAIRDYQNGALVR